MLRSTTASRSKSQLSARDAIFASISGILLERAAQQVVGEVAHVLRLRSFCLQNSASAFSTLGRLVRVELVKELHGGFPPIASQAHDQSFLLVRSARASATPPARPRSRG